ncbi:MAG: CBS domain-containing protein [Marinospirillum sp.]|uniref:CBS domain-containing protein n=1 Tax=Marinospirillum sp. TaxID=2183934 RepID=UPI0019FFEA28|nr:CBS domain-containing protein [Marinospirillum sp.]MBE0505097.1 CBS domain-containing protein [Marinospirillum sp.]
MLFPTLQAIATRDVICLDDTASLRQALELMNQQRIRSLLVRSARGYKLLLAGDLVTFHLQGVAFSAPLSQVFLPPALQLSPDASVEEAIRLISIHQAEQVCLVDADNQLKGIVSYTDLIQSLDPETLAENQRLSDLLRGVQLLQVNKEMPVSLVLSLMQQQGVNTALVSEDRVPLGILTQTDAIRLLQSGADLSQMVERVMSSPVFTLTEQLSIYQALTTIREKGFKRLVVVDEQKKVVGLISQQDLVSIYYNQWFDLVKKQQQELKENNQRLQQKNQALTLLLDEVGYPALLMSAQSGIEYANKAAVELFSVEMLQQGRSIQELLSGHQPVAALEHFFNQLALGRPAQISLLIRASSGEYQAYQLSSKPLTPDIDHGFTLLSFRIRMGQQAPIDRPQGANE